MKDETMKSIYASFDDKDLVDKTISGDYKAFEEIVSRYKSKVFTAALGITGGGYDLAQDVTQEVFVKAYFAISDFKKNSGLYTWLYRITLNTSYNILKKERRQRREDIKELNPVAATVSEKNFINGIINRSLFEKMLKALPAKYRVPLYLREFQNMSYEEIAEATGVGGGGGGMSLSKVKIRIFRARQRLKKMLEGKINL